MDISEPDSIATTRLGDLLELVIDHRGKTPKKLGGDFIESGVPVISAIHIKGGRIAWEERERFVSKEMFERWMKHPLQKGDVLLTSEAPLGEVAMVQSDDNLVLSQRLFALRPKRDRLDAHYLMYYLQSDFGQRELTGKASGSTVVGIKQAELAKISVPNQPLWKQRVIGQVLGSLDAKIAVNRQLSVTLESIARAVFESWFIDFDPVKAKMAGGEPVGMSIETASLFPDSLLESPSGSIPRGWQRRTLGELAAAKRGRTITRASSVSGDIPVVAGGLEPAYFHNMPNVSAPVVTISASGANAGFVRLYGQDIWASDCSFFSREESEHVYFVYAFLKHYQDKIFGMQQGAAQPHIYASDLARLSGVFSSDLAILDAFNIVVSPLFELQEVYRRQNLMLAEIRDALLPRLIAGQLEIPDEMLVA